MRTPPLPLVTALACLASAACVPAGWWWGTPVVDGQRAGDGIGSGREGEGEGEGNAPVGEGEGNAPVGEGEGEGEGEGQAAASTVWLEIDYSGASTPESPAFSFSSTPFAGSSWAMDGATYPEAWDRFQNMVVTSDPIGTSLELDGELQLMIGLKTLTSYDRAVVRLEGRAREVSSSVTFDVYNPLNNCGITGATMSNDWTVHVVDVDLGNCLVPGQGVQAVRVAPTSGTLALVRMRVMLENAAY